VIIKTVKDADPLLPTVLSVNLEGQHGTLLAGGIIGDLITMLARVELMCAGVLLLCIGAQWLLEGASATIAVRSALYAAATLMVLYDWRLLWPRIWKAREQFVEHADDPEIANPAREKFHRLERHRLTLLTLLTFLLLGLILFSTTIHQTTVLAGGHG
jgi:hypothetical protein